jgi:hypothetical protein
MQKKYAKMENMKGVRRKVTSKGASQPRVKPTRLTAEGKDGDFETIALGKGWLW